MNEQQQYEKHLAEKFQQLPLPDVEPNWQQMKALLDKEMPRGGGYWRWRTAFGLLLLMLGGTWFFISQNESGSLAGAGSQKTVDSASKLSSPTASERSSFEKHDPGREELPGASKFPGAATTDQQVQDVKPKNIDENLLKTNQNSTKTNNSQTSEQVKTGQGDSPGDIRGGSEKSRPVDQRSNRKSTDILGAESSTELDRRARTNESLSGDRRTANQFPVKDKNDNRIALHGSRLDPVQNTVTRESDFVKRAVVQYNTGNVVPSEIGRLIEDSIGRAYPLTFVGNNLVDEKLQKLSAKTKSAKVSAIESVQNRTLAIGVSLPLGFPLGDQKPGAYNVNARPNTISDFLPVPHMQYHLNNKVYLQTEVQLLNPQFIRPVLLFETKTDVPSSNTVYYNSVYARKLYYFNIPLGIHYSPFPHFYLGTGLQFSSFISGVALHEKTSYVIGSGTANLVSQRYERFRNDSISNRIDNSEFRLMLDANYYWKQFTVGLRYNQALSNYVSFRLNSISPLFQDKNKSLQFYLRYNLWEDYKRRATR